MKTEIKKFNFGDYLIFLGARLNPKRTKEFSKSLIGYFFVVAKSIFNQKKVYKFSIYYGGKLAGFAAIFDELGYYELGMFVFPSFREKGVATEAVKQIVEYTFKDLKMSSIKARVDEDKNISNKIAKRTGFKLIKKEDKINIWEIKNENSKRL